MKNLWSEILVPAAIAAMTLTGTLGVESARPSRSRTSLQAVRALPLKAFQIDTLSRTDTLAADTLALPQDSLAVSQDSLTARPDSLDWEDEDFDFFGESAPAVDTTPRITARDTMHVPDSIRETDPWLYRWWVATKDSLTHRIVVDSLRAEGDTIDWPRIDSLYLADSTAVAVDRFNRWYASLSKAERKRYDYEHYTLPAILHRQDSIQHRKDSIQAIRDSIRENTPRILETAFLPDSLYYKRLVAWRHDRHFNRVEVIDWDTTANYHFYDYPHLKEDVGASSLGMAGSAVQTYNFFKRDKEGGSVSFYEPYETWTYSPSSIPMFNTKTPYTELSYSGNLFNPTSKAADNVRVFTTQNILPQLNVALEYKSYGGEGTLQKEKTRNNTVYVTGNYLGKKYLAHAGFIRNSVSRTENGGITDITMVRDTTVDVREIGVFLSSASNKYTKTTWFFDQSYRIPLDLIERIKHRGDTTYVPADTLNTDMTTAFIGTSTEFTSYSKLYTDAISQSDAAGSAFYNGQFYMNPSRSTDSLHMSRLDNRVFLRLQPWHEDAVVSKVEGGAGFRHLSHYSFSNESFIRNTVPANWNSAYVYAGAEGRLSRYLEWDALGQYTFAGTEANDLLVRADARLNIFPFRRQPNSPVSLTGRFETTLKEPEFYHQHMFTNHAMWDNDFGKVSTTRIQASLDIPKWQFNASVGYALLANNIYYDTLGVVRQHTDPMSILSASLTKNFRFGPLHLDNSALLQFSSDPDAVPLPPVALSLRWYLQFPIVSEDVMKMQLGVHTRYTTPWYAPSFQPSTGVFINQKEYQYGNCPVFDVFLNVQWKQACVFVKLENAGQGWPMDKHDYFTAHHYIGPIRGIKVGIWWPFRPSTSENKTLSSRAGSGMSGGGGGRSGGGSGGMRGAISNFTR